MIKRPWLLSALGALALILLALAFRSLWLPSGAVAQAPPAETRTFPVEVATAVKKSVPVRIDALGNVTPIASVAIKSRLETEIVAVHFQDGALVKEGDLLFTLDTRTIEAQVRQAEGVVSRDKSQLEGAERDVTRYTDLVAKKATPQINLDNAKTQADTFRANITADQAALENLKVQLTYGTIRATISGRISAASVRIGNFVRPADTASLATINQIAPIYVAFSVPQRTLPEIRKALDAGTAAIEALVPGDTQRAAGRVTMIDNSVDATTGMVTIRATMENANQLLWPGTLVNAQLTLRMEDAVVVPSVAVQVSQTGNFVFVVKDGVASVRPVKVDRTLGMDSTIAQGLSDGERVVVDGQLLLSEGTRVAPRERKAGT